MNNINCDNILFGVAGLLSKLRVGKGVKELRSYCQQVQREVVGVCLFD